MKKYNLINKALMYLAFALSLLFVVLFIVFLIDLNFYIVNYAK